MQKVRNIVYKVTGAAHLCGKAAHKCGKAADKCGKKEQNICNRWPTLGHLGKRNRKGDPMGHHGDPKWVTFWIKYRDKPYLHNPTHFRTIFQILKGVSFFI